MRFAKLAAFILALMVLHSPLAAAAPTTIMVFGDSLTAGYGLPPEAAFPVRLAAKLHDMGMAVQVSAAGVSGDTTAGGLARLDAVLAA